MVNNFLSATLITQTRIQVEIINPRSHKNRFQRWVWKSQSEARANQGSKYQKVIQNWVNPHLLRQFLQTNKVRFELKELQVIWARIIRSKAQKILNLKLKSHNFKRILLQVFMNLRVKWKVIQISNQVKWVQEIVNFPWHKNLWNQIILGEGQKMKKYQDNNQK